MMLRNSLAFIFSLLFCFPVYAKTYELFVSNEHTKPMTIEKSTGGKITIYPNERVTNTFEGGTTVKNYVEGKFVCDWYIPSNTTHKLLGLVYGWYGNHPSHLGCSILMYN